MSKLIRYFLILSCVCLMPVSMALAQDQPNSISRDELIKITNLMEKMGLGGYCERRGLDSDIFLPYNQRFDLDEETSLYEIHCIAGASHAEYMYLALLKGNEEEGVKESLNLLYFPFPVVSGEGEDALIGVKVQKLLTNSGYNEKKKELSSSSSYHAGTVASIAVYKLKHVPGNRSLPEFILKEMIIDSISESEKVCNYLDMPVQHASDAILKSMRRGLNQQGIRERILRLRNLVPDLALRTTLIVGYPGETESEYFELKNFVEEIKFDRLGIFTYSEEEGTSASSLKDSVPRNIKDQRLNELQEIQYEISLSKNESFIGKSLKVLVDKTGENISFGRSQFDSPEIDNIVHIKEKAERGTFVNVHIESANEYELIGSIKP